MPVAACSTPMTPAPRSPGTTQTFHSTPQCASPATTGSDWSNCCAIARRCSGLDLPDKLPRRVVLDLRRDATCPNESGAASGQRYHGGGIPARSGLPGLHVCFAKSCCPDPGAGECQSLAESGHESARRGSRRSRAGSGPGPKAQAAGCAGLTSRPAGPSAGGPTPGHGTASERSPEEVAAMERSGIEGGDRGGDATDG